MPRLAVLAAVVTLAVIPAWAQAGATPRTAVTLYQAFTPSGQIIPHVRVESGYCWESSVVSARYDAFRCFVGNYIYDPCFSPPVGSQTVVVCPTPWNDTAIAISLTKPLPASFNHAAASTAMQPWAVQTTSGQDCVFASGATAVSHGVRENYFCGTGTGGAALWGYPARGPAWTIRTTPVDATSVSGARRVTLRRVWI